MKWDGKKITKPGVYDMPLLAYHGQPCDGPSVSSSSLRTIFTKSPAHFWVSSSLNPNAVPQEDTDAFILGRAAHHLLLGEDDFSTLFIVRPDELDGEKWQGNRKACKAWLAHQQAAGRTVLKPEQIEKIRGMAKSLSRHPLIQAGILNGEIEKSLIFRDKETGIWIKSRPDTIPNDGGDVADLKTTTHTGFDIDDSASKLRYDAQAAITKWALKAVLDIEMTSFSLVFVEKEPPHCVDVLTIQSEDIQRAEDDMRVALRVLRHCLDTGDWFGPSGTQNDARFLAFSQRVRERAEHRRDFLMREIAKSAAANEPSELEYLSTP